MRGERFIDGNFADRRTDGAESEAVPVEERFQFRDLMFGQVQYIDVEDGAKLDMPHAARFEDRQLPLRIGVNLVGKRTEGKHRKDC